MSWSIRFTTELERTPRRIRFQLEVLHVAGGVGGEASLSEVIVGAVSVSGQSVTPVSWYSTTGGFSVDLVGDVDSVRDVVRRGSLVTLRAGFDGWPRSMFERVALGRVKNIRALSPTVHRLEALDVFASLVSRFERSASADLELFAHAGTETTLAADYAVGGSTVTVDSATYLQKDSGSNGLLHITPNSGDAFYLFWSSRVGNVLTIDTPGSNRLNTTRAAASTGNAIRFLAHIKGHPFTIARKILTSTGDGTNGVHDTLPKTWGLGLPDRLTDHADLATFQQLIDHSGTYQWRVIVDAPQTSGWTWFRTLLAGAGIFPVVRQGQLSLRCAHEMFPPAHASGLTIEADDVVEVSSHDWWDPAVPQEHGGEKQLGPTGGTGIDGSGVGTLPALRYFVVDLQGVAWLSESLVLDEARTRLLGWSRTVPERLSLTLAGHRLARLTPGDVVRVSHPLIRDRAGEVLHRRAALVVSSSPDWQGSSVRVDLSIPHHNLSDQG